MQKRLEVGQIVNTFGIKGEVKVTPFTDDINRFDELKKVYVKTRKDEKLYKVENVRYHKNMVLLKLEGMLNLDSIPFDIYRKTVFESISLLQELKKDI